MLAVDTNVLVRYLTNDDAAQAKIARRLIDGNPIRLLPTVLLETEWVLRSLYGFDAELVREALTALLGLENVETEHADRVATALEWCAEGLDFADALHLAGAEEHAFATFDRTLAAVARKAKAGKIRDL